MRATLAVLLFALLAAIGADYRFSLSEAALLGDAPVVVGAGLAQRAIVRELPGSGKRERLSVHVIADGPLVLDVGGTAHDLRPGAADCVTLPDARLSCRLSAARPGSAPLALRLTPAGPGSVTVTAFEVRRITAQADSVLSHSPFLIVLAILVLALPGVWLLHRHYAASQWAIIAVSLTCLGVVQLSFTVVLLAFAAAVWGMSRWVARLATPRARLLVLLLGTSLTFLVAFKMFTPFLNELIAAAKVHRLLLPLGISYFVMRAIDVQLKAFRGQLQGYGFREFLCYMTFAPTVPAGPLETIDGFTGKRLSRIAGDDVAYGLSRILIGISKKLLIADALLAPVIERMVYPVGLAPGGDHGGAFALLLFANFLFAYIDFSAYSDIAVGLARLFGYRITENFNWPVLRRDLREYWQNWHMSLSNWAMRNIYLPVAVASRNKYVPIYATMIAIGLWHALGMPWFLWAVHHATGLTVLGLVESRLGGRRLRDVPVIGPPLAVAATIGFVTIGHSFVLFADVRTALEVYVRAWGLFGLLW